MSALFRRFLYSYSPSSILVGRDNQEPTTAHDATRDVNEIDLDAVLSDYEIITEHDADILQSPGTRLTIDVSKSDDKLALASRAPSAPESHPVVPESTASACDDDYLNLKLRPLTYVEVLVNGLPYAGQHARFNLAGAKKSTPPDRSSGTSSNFDEKMFKRTSGLSADEEEERYSFADRKMCRGREREKSLVMDRRARLRAVMV